ncbi:hypothetical protein [Paraburkholderia atlantica]|uniref:hypothetical protein n=1 Tax=Paraburkholderia atlantica TaxID=2654982 RepID=UPI001606FD75|nr:hypothetical protein [Paraburkholderia atlantica]MBB5509584.1 hypothetical protein [Paraburkholderia atlantica]
MGTNVKVGDLAIQIRSTSGNEGRIVEVLSFLGSDPVYEGFRWCVGAGPCWLVAYQGSPGKSIRGVRMKFMPCPDSRLRPISGVPIDEDVTQDCKEPV